MDVHEQLAEIRRTIENARSMPMSASVVVNKAEVLQQIDALAAMLPQAFAEADRVTSDRDGVVAQGRQEAERIIADARMQRHRMLESNDVYSTARAEADRILADARQEAEALRRETDDYVDVKFANFEIALTKTLEAVSRGRNRLQGRSELDALGSEDVDEITLPGEGA